MLDCYDGSRCSACKGEFRIVPGHGPTDAQVVLIGEGPGEQEDIAGRPFIGRSGDELDNTYLFRARLPRDEIYVTNVIRCRTSVSNKKPTQVNIDSCAAKFLQYELDYIDPRLIILAGASACSLCDPPIELARDHGIIVEREYLGRKRWVFPTYHPAAGMHNTAQMIPILEDFDELRKIISGSHVEIVDDYPNATYEEITDIGALRSLMEHVISESVSLYPPVGMDTETDEDRLWCVTFSTAPDNGFLIRATRVDLLSVFGEYAQDIEAVIHNDLFDLDPLEFAGGIRLYKVTDTMKMSYHQGNTPQGLKPLAWRLLRMAMRSYDDVVKPHSRDKMIDWMIEAQYYADKDKVVIRTPYKKPMRRNGIMVDAKVEEKPTELSKILKRVLDNTIKPQTSNDPYDPWLRIDELHKGSREKVARPELLRPIIDRIGKWPVESIIHVPFGEALIYAAEDARAALRIKPVLMKRCDDIAKLVSKDNWDK